MEIKIAVYNEKSQLERVKRVKLVKRYKYYGLYDVVDSEGQRLYSECYTDSEIEGRRI